jgi:N utilization substance protein A
VKNKQQFIKELQDFATEKNLPLEKAIEIIVESIKTVWVQRYNTDSLKITYDKKNNLVFERKLLVVPDSREIVDHISEIILEDALKISPKAIVGGVILKEVEPSKLFDRVMIEEFKQIFLKNILMFHRDEEFKKFLPMENTIALGLVKSIKNDNIIIGIEGVNTLLPRREAILTEKLREGEKIYVYIKEVKKEYTPGLYQVVVSRKGTEIIQLLLENVVPEINNDQIGVHKIVRIPGYKSKICLQKLVDTINPISVAIGYHGNRVRTLTKELKNEIVEFFEYTSDINELITSMLKKIRINPVEIRLNHNKKTATVVLGDKDIYNAIGSGGREVTMMRQFLPDEFDRLIFVKESDNALGIGGPEYYFGNVLNLDKNVTDFLESVGINSINKIMKMNPDLYYRKLLENEMNEDLAQLIYERASLYTQEKLEEFKTVEGVDAKLFMYYNLEPDASLALVQGGILDVDQLLNCDSSIVKKILSYYMNEVDIVDLLFQ